MIDLEVVTKLTVGLRVIVDRACNNEVNFTVQHGSTRGETVLERLMACALWGYAPKPTLTTALYSNEDDLICQYDFHALLFIRPKYILYIRKKTSR